MLPATRPCIECEERIDARRIAALPKTRLCVDCSEVLGGEERRLGLPENLAKSGSLKKNYGSFVILTVQRREAIEDWRFLCADRPLKKLYRQ